MAIRYICLGCDRKFDTYKVLHDYVRVGEDDYDDLYVCPFCRCQDFNMIEEDDDGKS